MSDANGGPSTSRGTRRSGVNTPHKSATQSAMVDKRESREESQSSQASSESRTFANREEKNLFTPTYGGNLFTAPTSNKRETKRNSRFSPPPPDKKTKKVGAEKIAGEKEAKTLKDCSDDLKESLISKKTTIPNEVFVLPPDFESVSTDQYRKIPRGGKDAVTTAKAKSVPRGRSSGPRVSFPPKLTTPTIAALAAFDFTEPSSSKSTAKPRGKSAPRVGVTVKKEPVDEEEEEDKPPRGRKKSKGGQEMGKEEMETPQSSRGRQKSVKVKEEPIEYSENGEVEEPPVEIQPKRGRKKGSAPPPTVVPRAVSVPSGRRKIVVPVVVKQEPLDDEEEDQSIVGRRLSMRGETVPVLKGIMKTEPDADAVPAPLKGPRKSVSMKELSPQPSTSASLPTERSVSRKRGRSAGAKTSPEVKIPTEEPPAKRNYKRRSTRSSVGNEEEGEGMEMEMEETPKEKEKTPGKRGRRTSQQILKDDLTDKEKAAHETDQGKRTRRRSSRSHGEESVDAASTSSEKAVATAAVMRMTGSASADSKEKGKIVKEEEKADGEGMEGDEKVEEENESIEEEEEKMTKRQSGGAETKESEKKVSTSTLDSSSMLLDESAADRSGYLEGEGDSSQEYDTEHEESMNEEGEHASTSDETPLKRGRGRPRKEGSSKIPVKAPVKARKIKEKVEPIVREKRQVMPNPKFAEYETDETRTASRRASAGAGMASRNSMGVSAAPLPSPRIHAPSPVVNAPSGSALSIMRNIHKKVLPSIRSPSPTVSGIGRKSLGMLTPAVATLADAPLIDPAAAAAEKKKKEEEKPGPSRQRRSSAKGRTSETENKVDEEEEKEKKVEKAIVRKSSGSDELARLAEYGSSSDSETVVDEKAATDTIWITPDCIRGKPSASISLPIEQKSVTGRHKVTKEAVESVESVEPIEEEKKEEVKDEDGQEKEDSSKPEESTADSGEKKEETTEDVLARWNESRKAIDQERMEAGLPALPHEPAPISSRASRRSINAPARFGDYDLNYGDVRKRSATVGSPLSTLPVSPVLSEGKKSRSKRKEESADPIVSTPTTRGEKDEEMPSGSKTSPSKKSRPRLLLKLKLGNSSRSSSVADFTATPDDEGEEEMEGGEDDDYSIMDDPEMSASPLAISLLGTPLSTATTSVKRTTTVKRDRRRGKATKPAGKKWKRMAIPHMGFIELDDKKVESVRLTIAATIDSMLEKICDDGIKKSTLSNREQASEMSRFSAAKRRAIQPPLPPGAARPRPAPFVLPPREERTKRIRHAPQSKEYDNLAVALGAATELTPLPSFQAAASLIEKRQTERRKESRQDAAIKKASMVAIEVAPIKDVEVAPVEKPKKEKKRDREKEVAVPKNSITFDELVRMKTYDMERLPGRVLRDTNDFFYREIFTDDSGLPDHDSMEDEVDVEGFTAPLPDEYKTLGSAGPIGVLAEETAMRLLEVLPRPVPCKDEDDSDEEEREWMEEDMKKALSHHSRERRKRVEDTLRVINSQRTANLAVEGTKGEQDVLYNTHVKHACRMKELMPIFSEFRIGESTWLHRALIRLLPSYLLPVYLEILRFLKFLESKVATVLSKSLMERGVDAEWDALFEKVQTDDDRTEPMLNGSDGATSGTSLIHLPSNDDVNAMMESVIKTLEEKEQKEVNAPAVDDVPPVVSPDSDQGLMIDEDPSQEEKEAAAAAVATEGVAAPATKIEEQLRDGVVFEEEVVVEEVKKADLVSVCSILSDVTDKRVKEANADIIHDSISAGMLDDVIPILVLPYFEVDDAPDECVMKNRPCDYVYRMVRYTTSTPNEFRPIKPRLPSGECTVAEAMDKAIEHITREVRAAVKNKGNKRVVLFGWGISCYINLRVAQSLHGISAIVNFAFPLRTADGWRGTPDDDINLTYCPTLFVMGDEADDFDAVELLHLRMNMIQPSGALILGHSDSQLNVSSHRLTRERITQKVAARLMMEQVVEFINMPANQLERAKLVPCQLNNIYAVEPTAMKAFSGQEAQQAQVTGGGRRPSNYTATVPIDTPGMTAAQSLHRRQQQAAAEEKRRKRSRLEEQTTAAGRLASSIASSAAPITKRSRTDDLPGGSRGARIAEFRLSVPGPSPLASPSLNSPGGYRMHQPAILSHHHRNPHHYYGGMQPSPLGGPSTSATAAASGLLLQTATTRPANAAAAAPSPRGPLDPASISLA